MADVGQIRVSGEQRRRCLVLIQLHDFLPVNMSYYCPTQPILTSAFSIILQVNKNSYSLLQKHVIALTVNVIYTHQQELMLNIDNSYIVTYNRTHTNTRYDME